MKNLAGSDDGTCSTAKHRPPRIPAKRLFAALGIVALIVAALGTSSAAPGHPRGGTGSVPCNDGTVTWSPTTLWPPNHKMQTITISYSDTDGDGDSIMITVDMITDDQAMADGSEELNGSGQPTDKQGLDWAGEGNSASASDPGTATTTAQVRSERSGRVKAGRHYDIKVTCNDMGGIDLADLNELPGQSQTVDLIVTVPHDQGHR